MSLFPTGKVEITPGAAAALRAAGVVADAYLARHTQGDRVICYSFEMVDGIIGHVEDTRPNIQMITIDEADHARSLDKPVAWMAVAVNQLLGQPA